MPSAGQTQPLADSSAAGTRSTSALFALTTAYSKDRAKAKPSLGRPRKTARQPVHSDGGSPTAAAAPALQPSGAAHSAPPPAAAVHAAPVSGAAGIAAAAAAAPSDRPGLRRKRSSNAELKLSCMLREAEAAQAAAGSRRQRAPSALQPGARPSPEPPSRAVPPPGAALPAAPAERLGAAASSSPGSKPKYVRMPGSVAAQQRRQAPRCEETVPHVTAAAAGEPAPAADQPAAGPQAASVDAATAAAHLGAPWTPQLVVSLARSKQHVKRAPLPKTPPPGSAKPKDAAARKGRALRILQHMGCPPGLSVAQVRVLSPAMVPLGTTCQLHPGYQLQ